MEMKFIFTGSLSITAGDDGLGPVEIEVVFTIIYLLAAIFGIEGLNSKISASLGDWVPKFLLWKHALASLFIFLLCLFTLENLVACAKLDLKRTIYYLLNPLLCLAFTIFAGFMESQTFNSQFVVFHLLYSVVFAVSNYRIMISNMTNSKFHILGYEHIFALIPIVFLLVAPDYEIIASQVCTVAVFILFYSHMYLLAQQYLINNPKRRFWTIL